MSTGRKNDLPNPSLFDPLPDVPTDHDLLKDVKSFFDSKGALPKYTALLRNMIEVICRKLSPQESFEIRLTHCIGSANSTLDSANTSNVEKGVAYRVTESEWQSIDDEAKAFVDNDNRYNVDWDHGNTVIFIPKVPLPRLQALDPHHPSDPLVLEKARWLFRKVNEIQGDALEDFYRDFAEVCDMMSPKDSFKFRLEAKYYFSSDNCGIDTDDHEKVEDGLQYHVHHASPEFPQDSFKKYVERDHRYTVDWGYFEFDGGYRVKAVNAWYGDITFVPKDPLPHMMDEDEDDEDNGDNDDEDVGKADNEDDVDEPKIKRSKK